MAVLRQETQLGAAASMIALGNAWGQWCSSCDGFARVCRALITISRSDGNNTCIIDCSRFGLDPAALANPAWVKAAVAVLEQDGYEVDIRRPNGGQYQKLVVAW